VKWFKSYCDGDWEHGHGISIETMDNPGWSIKIWLYETELRDVAFEEIKIEKGECDWMVCRVKDYFFEGFGDPNKLVDILRVFKNWVGSREVRSKKQEAVSLFSHKFKMLKFLKTGQIWKKSTEELTFTCNIENSKWSDETYYVKAGILINVLESFPHAPLGNIEIQIDTYGTAEDIFNRTIEWLNKYDSIKKLIDGCKKRDFPAIICDKILEQLNIRS
jgi:hypothetical protein